MQNDPFKEIKSDIGCGVFFGIAFVLILAFTSAVTVGEPLITLVVIFAIMTFINAAFGNGK
jgi:Mg/Co/Ni transporter MgtE